MQLDDGRLAEGPSGLRESSSYGKAKKKKPKEIKAESFFSRTEKYLEIPVAVEKRRVQISASVTTRQDRAKRNFYDISLEKGGRK